MNDLKIEVDQKDSPSGVTFKIRLFHRALKDPYFHTDGIFFRHPDNFRLPQLHVLDGFVLMFLFFGMEHARRIYINGPLSEKFIKNIQIFQEAWRCWRPDKYHIIELIPERVVSKQESSTHVLTSRKSGLAISAFSGGVDATFLAMRHAKRAIGLGAHDLGCVMMVHGFDVKCENSEDFSDLLKRTEPFLASLGLERRIVETNIRLREIQNWEHSFATQLAGILHQFSSKFDYGLIGSSEPYDHMINAWGSTPSTDYLLSGGDFEIVHDGAGYSRTEKAELINTYPIARRALKVCWQGEQDRNCGKCEKCIRTKLNFMAVGNESPECFDATFEIDSIRSLQIRSPVQLLELQTISEYAHKHGIDEPWVMTLDKRIKELHERSHLWEDRTLFERNV